MSHDQKEPVLEPKARCGASGYDLSRRDSHPLETANFAWCTQI